MSRPTYEEPRYSDLVEVAKSGSVAGKIQVARNWGDIGYFVAMNLVNDYVAQFMVWETAHCGNDEPLFLDEDIQPCVHGIENIDKAYVYMNGSIKWDGCSDIYFDAQDDAMLHFCGRPAYKDFAVLMDRLYDLAADLVPKWDGEKQAMDVVVPR